MEAAIGHPVLLAAPSPRAHVAAVPSRMTLGTVARSATSGPRPGPAMAWRNALRVASLRPWIRASSMRSRGEPSFTGRRRRGLHLGDRLAMDGDRHFGNSANLPANSSGRQVTLRTATAGGSIGIAAVLPHSISAQAITDCELLRLEPATAREIGTRPSGPGDASRTTQRPPYRDVPRDRDSRPRVGPPAAGT